MSSTYPSAIDVFTNPAGTDTLDSPDHAGQHSDKNDAIESMQAVMGTTAGTSVLKNFSAGNFPVRQNSSNVLQDTIANGTATALTIGTATVNQAFAGSAVLDEDTMASDSATSLATQQSIKAMHDQGWTAITETFTYASATTIAIAAGGASRFQKGDKLKLTNNTVKYFYIVGVADTLLTVTGGTDYTLANAAITSPQLSRIENPFGFPGWFNWTPTYGAGGSMTFTSVTTTEAKFTIKELMLYFTLFFKGTTGGSASNRIDATAPVTKSSATDIAVGSAMINDGGWVTFPPLISASSRIDFYKAGLVNYGLGADRELRSSGFYRI